MTKNRPRPRRQSHDRNKAVAITRSFETKAAIFCVALMNPTSLPAETASGFWGVWKGKTNGAAIYLCIQADPTIEPNDDFAAIYTTADNQIELLDRNSEVPTKWTSRNEPTLSATLSIISSGLIRLDRNVTDPWSGVKLDPIPFTKGVGMSQPCASPEFNQVRAVMPRLQVSSHMLGGVQYNVLKLVDPASNGEVSTFQLPPGAHETDKINTWLRAILPKTAEDAPYYTCTLEALSAGGGSLWQQRVFPEMISDHFVVVGDSSDVYCGGPYPDSFTDWHVFDNQTGDSVDTRNWMHPDAFNLLGPNAGAGPEIGDPAIENGFRDLMTQTFAATNPDKSCRDFLDEVSIWDIRPSKTGLIFQPQVPHISQACADDLKIDYRDLSPFLAKDFQKADE